MLPQLLLAGASFHNIDNVFHKFILVTTPASEPAQLARRGGRVLLELAYATDVHVSLSLGSELRGRFWFNHFGRQSLFDVSHAHGEHWPQRRPAEVLALPP